MNFKKHLPALICGFGAAVLTIVPGIKNFSCCLIVPGAAVFALFLEKKATQSSERISAGRAIVVGLLTGVFATIFITSFDTLITFLTRTNDFIEALPQSEIIMNEWNLGPMVQESLKLMKSMATEIRQNGFSILYLVMIFISNFITNTIFGMIGGLVGMSLFNRRKVN